MKEKYLPGEEETMVEKRNHLFFLSHIVYLCLRLLAFVSIQQLVSTLLNYLSLQGRLGLGTQDTHNSPQQVCLPVEFEANKVVCGVDCSMIISTQYSIVASGSNR